MVTPFHAQNVSESLNFFGYFALSIHPHGFLSLFPPTAIDCCPDITTLGWGVTFAHRVAYLGGLCCRCVLFSAVRLPNECLASANSFLTWQLGFQ